MSHPTKVFSQDLLFFMSRIEKGQHFTLTRFGDGEMMVMFQDTAFDNRQFSYDANSDKFKQQRELLLSAFRHQDKSYYVGIACRCCVGDKDHEMMKELSHQPSEQLTWSNIFVNTNYSSFLFHISKVLKGKSVVVIANQKADLTHVPFRVDHFYGVGPDAWIKQLDLIDQLKSDIRSKNLKNHVFLMCAGPFANLIGHQLFQFEPNNSYLDIGSSLDITFGLNPARDYQTGTAYLDRTCVW